MDSSRFHPPATSDLFDLEPQDNDDGLPDGTLPGKRPKWKRTLLATATGMAVALVFRFPLVATILASIGEIAVGANALSELERGTA
jgi:hypothetical protein